MSFKLPTIDRIIDPVAQAVFGRREDDGRAIEFVIAVGRPEPFPGNQGWFGPVSIEGVTSGVVPIVGAFSVDALSNALRLVSKTLERRHAYPVRAL